MRKRIVDVAPLLLLLKTRKIEFKKKNNDLGVQVFGDLIEIIEKLPVINAEGGE